MPWMSRFRERLVLGHVRESLTDGEQILAWTHVRIPGVRAPGVLVVTDQRCLLHVASYNVDDRANPWVTLQGWRLERPARARATLTLVGDAGETVGELSLTSRRRARSATAVLDVIAERAHVPGGIDDTDLPPSRGRRMPQLQAAPRGFREHARRVVVTVAGVVMLLVSVVFASPFVPGPGALTALAGIAILASEYEWARDVHVWASRQLERFLAWFRRKRRAFSQRRSGVELATNADPADPDGPTSKIGKAA